MGPVLRGSLVKRPAPRVILRPLPEPPRALRARERVGAVVLEDGQMLHGQSLARRSVAITTTATVTTTNVGPRRGWTVAGGEER